MGAGSGLSGSGAAEARKGEGEAGEPWRRETEGVLEGVREAGEGEGKLGGGRI